VRAQQRAVVHGLDLGQVLGPPLDPGGDRAQQAAAAAATAASTSAAPPRAISASASSPTGDTSVNVPADGTRWPPIQCRVSTATPAIFAVPAAMPVPIATRRADNRCQ
jgi:hypothetical protein